MADQAGRKLRTRGARGRDGARSPRAVVAQARVNGDRPRVFGAAAVLIVAGTVAYWNSFAGLFVFDDQVAILQNELLRQVLPIERFFASSQPLNDFTLAINYALGGLEPWGYHFFNLCVHLAAGLVLFGVVRRTILRVRMPPARGGGVAADSQESGASSSATMMAFTIALLWLVHPLQTESVTYLIQRCESMMGLFYLATLYAAIRASEAVRPGRWMTVSVVCCAAGMATKAVAVTAPVVVLLYDRTFLAGTFGSAIRRRWRLYAGLSATWLVLAALGVFRGLLYESAETATVGFGYAGVTPLEYLRTQPGVILHYLRLAVWPVGLCLDYDWAVAQGFWGVWAPSAVVVGLIIASVWGTWRRHPFGYAGAWFFLILLPTSSFIPIKDLAFEHRMYLPLAGVAAVVVGMWMGMVSRLVRASGWLRYGMVGVAAVCLMVLTVRRNAAYSDEIVLWSQNLERTPENARVLNSLGYAYLASGDVSSAMSNFEAALAVEPNYVPAIVNLGKSFLLQRRFDEGVRRLERARELGPAQLGADAHFAYGSALIELGRPADAIEPLRHAISLNQNYIPAYYNLGNALWLTGQGDRAVGVYQQALSIEPAYTEARVNLGMVLMELGRTEEAVSTYRAAIRLFGSDGSADALKKAHYGLGLALRSQGQLEEAAKHFREVLRIDPVHRGAREALEHF